MSNVAQIRNYIQSIALDEDKLDLQSFFTIIHSKFFSDRNISFMEYFLKLIDKDEEFCIPDTNLKRYGIITPNQSSSHIPKRLPNMTPREKFLFTTPLHSPRRLLVV